MKEKYYGEANKNQSNYELGIMIQQKSFIINQRVIQENSEPNIYNNTKEPSCLILMVSEKQRKHH